MPYASKGKMPPSTFNTLSRKGFRSTLEYNRRMIINILHVEDNPADVFLVRSHLYGAVPKSAVKIAITPVDCMANAIKELSWRAFDIILLDMYLPDSRGIETLQAILKKSLSTPIVILSGSISGLDIVEQCLALGASDVLDKDEVTARDLLNILIKIRMKANQAVKASQSSDEVLKHLQNAIQKIEVIRHEIRNGSPVFSASEA